jgi:hypothetical protein
VHRRVGRLERGARHPPDLLGQLGGHGEGDVDLALLECDQPCGRVGDHAQDQALDRRGLAPVAVEGLEHQLDSRLERDEAVGAGADGRLLEAVLADLLDVLLRHDPRRGGGLRPVVGHEVGPRLAEPEADVSGIGRLDGGDPLLEGLGVDAAIALEGELDVVGGDGLAGMELRAFAEDELVDEPVGRHGPRLGEARRHCLARHRLDERVVQSVQDHERGAGERFRRVEVRGTSVVCTPHVTWPSGAAPAGAAAASSRHSVTIAIARIRIAPTIRRSASGRRAVAAAIRCRG